MFDAERTRDMEARFTRFQKLFQLQGNLWDLVNDLLNHTEVKHRKGDEHDLSLLVGASFGKALKTFYGINDLCLAGWGEDALVLLRSNVNLLINLSYILRDPQPIERAADFIAFSYTARVKYLKRAHGVEKPPWKSTTMSDDELKLRAKRWDDVRISERAARVPKFHYTTATPSTPALSTQMRWPSTSTSRTGTKSGRASTQDRATSASRLRWGTTPRCWPTCSISTAGTSRSNARTSSRRSRHS